ncbi:MAG: DUF2986 domain-containing protein [Halopseudomonas sp.]
MNRRKMIKQKLEKKAKKTNARNQISNKPRYVSKADREAPAAESDSVNSAESS